MDVASQQKVMATYVIVHILARWLLHILNLAIYNICDLIIKEPTTFSLAYDFFEHHTNIKPKFLSIWTKLLPIGGNTLRLGPNF